MILTLNLRPDVTVLAVPVPEGEYEWDFLNIDGKDYLNGIDHEGEMKFSHEPLPPGSYELIGLLREFKDAEELAVLNTAIHSAGGDPKQNWLLIKKIA